MSSDRELLEKAAKAAGYEARWREPNPSCGRFNGGLYFGIGGYTPEPWNPLTNDGDALRLACVLKINIEHMHTLSGKEFGINCWPYGRGDCGISEDGDLSDYCVATRRAIVRAAAALADATPSSDGRKA